MSRPVRRHRVFAATVADVAHWLRSRRSAAEVERLRAALERVTAQLAEFPRLGREADVHAGLSIRVIRLGRLPYLVWYGFDPTRARTPVWLLLLMHERQDRSGLDPAFFDEFVRDAARETVERGDW